MMNTIDIVFVSNKLQLSSQKALFHADSSSLVIADVHLGKTSHFREHGVAVPQGSAEEDIKNLDKLIAKFNPKTLIISGDLFHSRSQGEVEIFSNWREKYPLLKIFLARGNHDRQSLKIYDSLKIVVANEFTIGRGIQKLIIRHEPATAPETEPIPGLISGHIHPGYILHGKARQTAKLACFVVSDSQIILPAFGSFTGLKAVNQIFPPNAGHTFFVVLPGDKPELRKVSQ